jgi:hypothetical protein
MIQLMADTTEPSPHQRNAEVEGAILSDDQIRKLRIGVIVMSIALVAGVAMLIGRVIYLANRGNEQGVPRGMLAADPRLMLPAGASLKSTALSGDRLSAHYTSPKGDGVIILDLVTGKTLSHVRIEAGP